MSAAERPKDYWGDAWPHAAGPGWVVAYRVPWKARPDLLRENGQVVVFQCEAKALRAAMNHLCNLMCPHLTAGGSEASQNAKEEAEALFAKGGTIGSVH